jgi:site-specific DNA recombinase
MIRARCAIYTRKSTEEGLDQSFNSLDAQREACAAYILSQRHEGWAELPDRYDDGGFSGGSMERPGLQRLLDDVRAGRINVIVVYKVDRLTRALSDFAKMVDVFDAAGVSFVSVTQAFNTTTSMGRLTLNVLLSFAQFEREVTAERIRDKVTASKRKGLWMGGAVPMGYDVKDKALVVNAVEAEVIRTIYRDYLALRSVPALIARLAELGIISKRRTDRFGRVTGGAAYSRGALYHLLRNPTYIEKVKHKGEVHQGQHAAIVDTVTWQAAQEILDANRGGKSAARRKNVRRWLDGVFFDAKGTPLKTTYSLKAVPALGTAAKRRYWYYTSRPKRQSGPERGERLPAPPFEAAVRAAVAKAFADRSWLMDALAGSGAGGPRCWHHPLACVRTGRATYNCNRGRGRCLARPGSEAGRPDGWGAEDPDRPRRLAGPGGRTVVAAGLPRPPVHVLSERPCQADRRADLNQ